jgi:uncharacterized membrane protein YoaK (UPF0700 family)
MNQTGAGSTAFGISIGLAFVGGYADASSYLLARTLTGHLAGGLCSRLGRLSSNGSSKADPPSESARLSIRVLAPMWIGFICAFAGAVTVSSFHSVGLLGIVVPLVLLIFAELKTKWSA